MGRTNPTFRDQLRPVERRWQPFRRALRRRDRPAFDRLFRAARDHANAGGSRNHAEPLFPVLVAAFDDRSGRERVRLPGEATGYDDGFYRDRLVRAAASVLSPVGWRRGDVEAYLASRTNASLAGFGAP